MITQFDLPLRKEWNKCIVSQYAQCEQKIVCSSILRIDQSVRRVIWDGTMGLKGPEKHIGLQYAPPPHVRLCPDFLKSETPPGQNGVSYSIEINVYVDQKGLFFSFFCFLDSELEFINNNILCVTSRFFVLPFNPHIKQWIKPPPPPFPWRNLWTAPYHLKLGAYKSLPVGRELVITSSKSMYV